MSVRLSCPSCNTAFELPAVPADRRATCPRCGDPFPIRGEITERATVAEAVAPPPAVATRAPLSAGMWSMRRAALVALTLGAIGFAVGLATYYSRGSKSRIEPEPSAATATVIAPAQLVGLGYLPAECNAVFAVQPGPLLTYAARTNRDPRELLAAAGVPAQALTAFDQTGLTLAQIDHITGGVFVGNEGDELRVALVLVLKQPPADEDAFLGKLKAKPALGKKTRYTVDLAKLPLTLARVSPTVWVFGLADKDFAAVDRGGFGPGGKQFRGSEGNGFRQMLGLVPSDAAVWVAADDDRDWTQKPLVKLVPLSADVKKGLPALSGFRGGAVALSFGDQPRMRLVVRTADTAGADRVRGYFQARAAETESATVGGEGTLARFDAPYDPATSRGMLQRFVADATK